MKCGCVVFETWEPTDKQTNRQTYAERDTSHTYQERGNKNKSSLPLTDRATRCLRPTVLYTDVDGQCHKLVTDDHYQFITLTVYQSRQHLRRLVVPDIWLMPTNIYMVYMT